MGWSLLWSATSSHAKASNLVGCAVAAHLAKTQSSSCLGDRNGKSVAGVRRRTGKRVWSALDDKASFSAPTLATIVGCARSCPHKVTCRRLRRIAATALGVPVAVLSDPAAMILGARVFVYTSSGGEP